MTTTINLRNAGAGIRESAAAKPKTRDSRGRFVTKVTAPALAPVNAQTEITADRAALTFDRCGCGRYMTEAVRYAADGEPLIASGCESAFDGGAPCAIRLNGVDFPRGVSYRPIARRIRAGSAALDTHALKLEISVPGASRAQGLLQKYGNKTLKRLALPLMAMAGMAIALAL